MKRLTYVIAFAIVAFAVVKIIMGISHATKESGQDAEKYGKTSVVIDSVASADGVMVYYDVRGEAGPALVFVHGWSCDRSYWSRQVDEFAQEFTVVTLDLAGHGQSGQNRSDWTIPAFGADVAAVVDKLNLEKAILIGHSMGGPVIIEAARQLPGRVIGLVGVDTYNDVGTTYPDSAIEAHLASFLQDFRGTTYRFVTSMFPDSSDSSLMHQVADDMSSAPQEVALESYRATIRYVYTDPIQMIASLKELNLPVRGINCDHFPLNLDGMKAATRSFDIKVMTGVGHFLHMQDPQTFNGLLHEIITELISEPGSK